jgi:ADP-ribose pyrophosphatase YjhB (NUDIX family)
MLRLRLVDEELCDEAIGVLNMPLWCTGDVIMSTIGVFTMIFNEAGMLLCVRRNYATHNWTTPGGRVNAGESPVDALKPRQASCVRELKFI